MDFNFPLECERCKKKNPNMNYTFLLLYMHHTDIFCISFYLFLFLFLVFDLAGVRLFEKINQNHVYKSQNLGCMSIKSESFSI